MHVPSAFDFAGPLLFASKAMALFGRAKIDLL